MDLTKEINKIKEDFLAEVNIVKTSKALADLEVKYLGRKGEMTRILRDLKNLAANEKQKIGSLANQVKNEILSEIKKVTAVVKGETIEEDVDISRPGHKIEVGHLHPSTQVQYELEEIFKSMGFMVLEGPEIESDYYNFESLNIPTYHPARDAQDTFYLEDGNVLRTHTSNMQVRTMQKYGAPVRAVFPGRVFRYEATDASHETTFYQLEGLMVGEDINIGNLVATMKEIFSGIFNKEVKVRLRPGYFPFVEPGFELDVECLVCGGKGCPVCKKTGWVEMIGCGMVHPEVLKFGKVDPKKYTGFAFGLGMTRLVMLKHEIDDIRLLLSGDLRFLKQF
ncbi:phenylalanine--tRNA ligase subunit alpha [Patescibacteria group bacterium]|nr:phenylalanine--tRNA ligase subunit alpha [Patescibacteria group bacterium]